jgi:AraC-like DNA-binding protein
MNRRILKSIENPVVLSTKTRGEIAVLANSASKIVSAICYSEEARRMHGPTAVRIAKGRGSLRSLAKRCGLSPTYLSLIQKKKTVISPGAFVLLVQICAEVEQ